MKRIFILSMLALFIALPTFGQKVKYFFNTSSTVSGEWEIKEETELIIDFDNMQLQFLFLERAGWGRVCKIVNLERPNPYLTVFKEVREDGTLIEDKLYISPQTGEVKFTSFHRMYFNKKYVNEKYLYVSLYEL